MALAYDDAGDDVLATYRRVHANGEQTRVAIVTAGEGYAAVAYDIDPREYVPVAADCVAFDPTEEGVRQRAERWMEANPKGVVGDGQAGQGGGFASKLNRFFWRALKKLNNYGNQQMQQLQENQPHQEDRQ